MCRSELVHEMVLELLDYVFDEFYKQKRKYSGHLFHANLRTVCTGNYGTGQFDKSIPLILALK